MRTIYRDAGPNILNIRIFLEDEAVSRKRFGLRNITLRAIMVIYVAWVTASTIRAQRDVDLLPATTFTERRIRKQKYLTCLFLKFDRRYGTV